MQKRLGSGLDLFRNNLLLIILVLQPFLDILAYIQRDSAVSLAGYFRLALTVLLPVYVLFFARERKKFIVSMAVIVVFCALHAINGFRVGYISLFTDVKYMLLVAHAIVLLYSFLFLYDKNSVEKQVVTAMKCMVVTVVITYYLSYFLKSGIHTYMYSQIGWTGWNNTPSVFSIILSALLPFGVYFCVTAPQKWWLIGLIPLCGMYILNGTKAAYLTLIVTLFSCCAFLVLEFFVQKKEKIQILSVAALALLLVLSIFAYGYSPRADMDDRNNNNIEKGEQMLNQTTTTSATVTTTTTTQTTTTTETTSTTTVPSTTAPTTSATVHTPEPEDPIRDIFAQSLDAKMVKRFGKDRYLAAYEGNMTAESMADNRLRKIVFGSLVWEDTDALTKFVGFEQTLMYIGEETYDLESDPQAIYFYYGYIGTALYFGMLAYFWLRLLKQLLCHFKESFTFFNFIIFIMYALLMLSAVYTGHLFRRPNSAIYLTIVLLLVYCRTQPLFNKKSKQSEDK